MPGKTRCVVGLLRPETVVALREDNDLSISQGLKQSWLIFDTDANAEHVEPSGKNAHAKLAKSVYFAEHLNTPALRSDAIQTMCLRWRDTGRFPNVISGRLWRDELYPVYANPFNTHEEPVFTVERVTAAFFGLVTYGVHMTIYLPPKGPNEELKIWVSKRAMTKQTWPGLFDNTIAGGLVAGIPPFECLMKESMEEGSISEDIIKKYARCTGAVSYYFQTQLGWLQPEVEYTYELAVPHDCSPEELEAFTPKPLDGEVETFELLSVPEVVVRMHKKLFKPNCAIVLIEFLIRHGVITPENEPNFLEILTRMHGRFDYDQW